MRLKYFMANSFILTLLMLTFYPSLQLNIRIFCEIFLNLILTVDVDPLFQKWKYACDKQFRNLYTNFVSPHLYTQSLITKSWDKVIKFRLCHVVMKGFQCIVFIIGFRYYTNEIERDNNKIKNLHNEASIFNPNNLLNA